MRKLRFAAIFPIVQIVVAAILLRYGHGATYLHQDVATPRFVCYRLNAPALLIRLPLLALVVSGEYAFGNVPSGWSALGFDVDDLVFLPGVGVVWYFVGRAVDRWRDRGTTTGERKRRLVTDAFLLLLAAFLFRVGVIDVPRLQYADPLSPFAHAAPYFALAWSFALAYLGGRGIVQRILAARATARRG